MQTMDEKETDDLESLSSEGESRNLFAKTKFKDNESSDESEEETHVQKKDDTGMDAAAILPRRKRFIPKYEVEGVAKIVLSEETQAMVELCIGPDVNAQKPWKNVKKLLILEDIDNNQELSDFFSLKDKLTEYEEEEILFGYVVDESKDFDEFYICFTKAARDHCQQQSDKFYRRQQKKLEKAVQKKPGPWTSLGSESEIIELIPVNTRPLLQLEYQSRFPSEYQPEKFKSRDSTSVRDGYIELTPYRVKYVNVFRKRVDTATQVAPGTVSTEAQTVLRYPKNVWTQSVADSLANACDEPEAGAGGDGAAVERLSEESESSTDDEGKTAEKKDESIEAYKAALKRMRRPSQVKLFNNFMKCKHDEMASIAELNGVMDMYANDYPELVKTEVFDKFDTMKFDEYVCFTDVRAKNKYISYSAFHPMWTGVVAISYSVGSPTVMTVPGANSDDPIERMVYGLNPVMIWSHIDSLMPKLYLEVTREVKVLSFCPFNENILLGGCVNGQVVIWDLTNKLQEAESFEILSETREKYRLAIQSQMGWMKNIHDKSIVPTTALSVLLHSHSGPINIIRWLTPNYTITPTGRKLHLEPDQKRSLIFVTGSEDGTILVWNLSLDNVTASLEGKKIKKSKRVPIKPAALTVGVSPYSILDRNLQPIYKIILGIVGTPQAFPVQTIGIDRPLVTYHHIKKNDGSGRKYFSCTISEEVESNNRVFLGTTFGEVLKLSWEGHDFNTGEVVNSEYCNIKFRCTLHDGAITTNIQNPFIKEVFLTIGGKIFAVWTDEIQGKPVFWKKRPSRITDASWSRYKPSLIFLTTSEGTVESWDFLLRTHAPIAIQTLSGCMMTRITVHTLRLPHNIIGVSDVDGSFRMFLAPPIFMLESPTYADRMRALIAREVAVQKSFHQWQEKWWEKNQYIIEEMRRKEMELQIEKEEQKKKELEEEEKLREEREEALKLLAMRVITPAERWQGIINKLIERTIAVKKRINRVELLQQEMPLRELEAQRLEKEKKMLEVMKNQNNIFNEIIGIWFPEAIEKKIVVEKTLSYEERAASKRVYMDDYVSLSSSAKETVSKNPYRYEFQWMTTVAEGRERSQALNSYSAFIMRHKARLEEDSDVQ